MKNEEERKSHFIVIIQMTASKNIAQANKSFAKHNPKTKYAMLNTAKSKSDTFVL